MTSASRNRYHGIEPIGDRLRFWKWVFLGKGVYNLLVPPLLLFVLPSPADPLYFHGFLALAWIFGYGYFRVGTDPTRNRDIVRMGVVGQAAVCLLALYHRGGLSDSASMLIIGGGLVDGVAAGLFLYFLSRHRAQRAG